MCGCALSVSSGCSNCSPYSYCEGEGDSAHCACLPGYRRTKQGKCGSKQPQISVFFRPFKTHKHHLYEHFTSHPPRSGFCSARDCDVNAQCSTQGSKVSCACKPDYEGDGRVCVPKNPCARNNGGCPFNSTYCVFEGPNKVREQAGTWC